MTIARYRRKPKPESADEGLTVAHYEPGKPLDDLRAVAALAYCGAVAECEIADSRVLVVAWEDASADDGEITCYDIVRPGDYLAFSHGDRVLFDDDEADLRQFYEPVP